MRDTVELSADVLVIGGGLGGVRAALEARASGASVILAEKAVVSRAGPMTYVHSQFAPNKLLEGQEMHDWVEEFVIGSNYLADQDWTEMFLRDSYYRHLELLEMGVPYERDAKGELHYVIVRGHKIGTTLGVDGRKCMEVLRRRLKAKRVELLEKVAMLDLLTSDGRYPTAERVSGAVGVHVQTGTPYVIKAKSVLLCTGPFYPKMHFAFVDHCAGEGHMMAYKAGAELAGMEFGQFAAWSYFNKEFFTPGQAKIQGIGAKFINRHGERFMDKYDPIWGDKTGLIQLARGIITENIEQRGPCSVDMRHCTPQSIASLYEVAPSVGQAFKEFNVDPLKQTMTVNPMMVFATSSSSGLRIGLNGETNVEGLYAAGACTCLPHMMAGISGSAISTASHVTGYRAAGEMVKRAKSAKAQIHDHQVQASLDGFFAPQRKFRPTRPTDLQMEIAKVTCQGEFSLYKDQQRIETAIKQLDGLNDMLPKLYAPDTHELIKAHDAKTYLRVTQLVARAMGYRTESRAELFRVDYPYRDDDNWLKWVIMRNDSEDPDAEPTISTWTLPYDRWSVKPPTGKQPTTYYIPERYRKAAA